MLPANAELGRGNPADGVVGSAARTPAAEFSLSGALFGGADEDEFFRRHWKHSFRRYPDGGRGVVGTLPTLAEVQEIISAPAWDRATMISYLSLPREGSETHASWET